MMKSREQLSEIWALLITMKELTLKPIQSQILKKRYLRQEQGTGQEGETVGVVVKGVAPVEKGSGDACLLQWWWGNKLLG